MENVCESCNQVADIANPAPALIDGLCAGCYHAVTEHGAMRATAYASTCGCDGLGLLDEDGDEA